MNHSPDSDRKAIEREAAEAIYRSKAPCGCMWVFAPILAARLSTSKPTTLETLAKGASSALVMVQSSTSPVESFQVSRHRITWKCHRIGSSPIQSS